MKPGLPLLAAALLLCACGKPKYEEAYAALGSPEARKRDDRTLINEALLKEGAPVELGAPRRYHKKGTIVLLRYELSDDQGRGRDAFEVRALVPPLPPLAEPQCGPACREGLAERKAVLLERSGEPGLLAEWVMRMPIGRTISLERRALVTQDLFSKTARRTPEGAVKMTMVDACQAEVFVGSRRELELQGGFPRLFTRRWTELSDCEDLVNRPPDEHPPPAPIEEAAPSALGKEKPGPWSALAADARVVEACRYDLQKNAWLPLSVIQPFAPPRETGLYWASVLRAGATQELLIQESPVDCTAPLKYPPPRGALGACVPEGGKAEMRHVPEPAANCRAAARPRAPKRAAQAQPKIQGEVLAACRFVENGWTWARVRVDEPFRVPEEPGVYWIRSRLHGQDTDSYRTAGYDSCAGDPPFGSTPPGQTKLCVPIAGELVWRFVADPAVDCVKAFAAAARP